MSNRNLKLGKSSPKIDPRTLKLEKYLLPTLPPPPSTLDNTRGVTSWGMMLNDTLGDCTIAGVGHFQQLWTGTSPSDADILAGYENVCGYNPSDPNTDQGGVEIDVLNYWRQNGIAGHKIIGYADPQLNQTHMKQAIYLFGGVYIGVELPLSAQNQSSFWEWESDENGGIVGSWGGHCVDVVGYNAKGPIFISWGQVMGMSWGFWDKYVSEAHAPFSAEWTSPEGFDYSTLLEDLSLITG